MAGADATMANVEVDEARVDLAIEVTMQAVSRRSALEQSALAEAEISRVRLSQAALEALVATGQARAGDVFALRTRIQTLELSLADQRRQIIDAEEDMHALLGLAVDVALPPVVAPDPSQLTSADDPMLRKASVHAAAAGAAGAMARSRSHPVVSLGAGWESDDLDRSDDTWKAMITVSIPLWQDAYAADQRAAASRVRAAESEREQAARSADALVRRVQRAREQALAAQTQADATAGRVAAELEALDAELASGEPTALRRMLDRLDAAAEASRSAIAARAEADILAARLWRFAMNPSP